MKLNLVWLNLCPLLSVWNNFKGLDFYLRNGWVNTKEFNSNTRYKVVNEGEETKLVMNKFNKFNLPSLNVAYNISF